MAQARRSTLPTRRIAALGAAVVTAALMPTGITAAPAEADRGRPQGIHPALADSLVAFYDFDHPASGDPAVETDLGHSRTPINLVNGGENMRVADRAYRHSGSALQTRQVNPEETGNDDWKAGTWSDTGVSTLHAYNAASGATLMGWFNSDMDEAAPNSNTANPDDKYNAIGLSGVLTGDSEGHNVRALLELIEVDGQIHLVALGRRLDGGLSQTFAASEDWRTILPRGQWVHLAATFDFTTGRMALYKNGEPLEGFYTRTDDPWKLAGPGPHLTTASDPRGIKIGGSFPQNNRESNPCNCRMDGLIFLDDPAPTKDVRKQYHFMTD